MKDWYLGLAQREQMMVAAGGVVVLFALVWGLLINPVFSASAAAERRIETKRDTLIFLRAAAAELAGARDLPADRPDLAGQSLVVIIDRTARQAGLGAALTNNQPVGEDGIRVRLESAPFEAVARWLAALSQDAGLAIESASFDRAPEAGRVNASLTLRQGLQ
jgi:general secretion pathway protein M